MRCNQRSNRREKSNTKMYAKWQKNQRIARIQNDVCYWHTQQEDESASAQGIHRYARNTHREMRERAAMHTIAETQTHMRNRLRCDRGGEKEKNLRKVKHFFRVQAFERTHCAFDGVGFIVVMLRIERNAKPTVSMTVIWSPLCLCVHCNAVGIFHSNGCCLLLASNRSMFRERRLIFVRWALLHAQYTNTNIQQLKVDVAIWWIVYVCDVCVCGVLSVDIGENRGERKQITVSTWYLRCGAWVWRLRLR